MTTTIMLNNTNVTIDQAKETLVQLLLSCAILPDSKVLGHDMFGRKTRKSGLKGLFNSMHMELLEQLGAETTKNFLMEVMEEYNDKLKVYLDREEDLFKNEEVDNLVEPSEAARFELESETHFTNEWMVMGRANDVQDRHDRMVYRLAVVDLLKETKQTDLIQHINDELVERLMNGEHKIDKRLAAFVISKKELARKESEILRKDQAAYFRKVLENKAIMLREFSYKAEQMQAGRMKMDQEFINMVIKLANRTKVWVEARDKRPKPYSKRALNALWNEACYTLHALGIFRAIYPRLEYKSTDHCSFFMKSTAEDMVEVKSGLDWADDLRALFYETDDGCYHAPVRGSNN